MKKTVTSLKAALAVCVCVFAATASWAANGSWSGAVNALWTNSANWSATPYPSGTEIAFFTNNASATTINVAGLSSIKYITFDSPYVAAYTLGTGAANSQTNILADSGEIKITGTAASSQVFNAGVQLGLDKSAQSYSLRNDSPVQALTFNNVFGAASGGTAGDKTLTINGVANVTIRGNLSKGGANNLNITDANSGLVTLAGTNTILNLNMTANGKLALPGSNLVTTLNMNGGMNSVVDIGSGYLALNNGGSTSLTSSQGGTINGTGTLWFKASGDNSVAAGKTLVINVPSTSDGIFEFYSATACGTFVFNATNTFPSDILLNGPGAAISVWKVGNQGSLDSNLGKGTNINFNVAGTKLIYTGIGEDSDRIILLNNSATIDQSGTGKLKFTSPLTANATVKTLTLQGSTSGIGEIAGIIPAGSGTATALAKTGSGTWILSATNTYGGTTTVNGGTLLVNSPGSIASSVTVNKGALLGGDGTVNGSVTLATGGMLAPARIGSIGTLSITNALTLNGNTLFFDIDASNVSTDKVAVAGALTVNGTNTVYLSFPSGIATVGTNTLITFGSQSGSGSFVLAPGYANGYLMMDATSLSLVVTNTGIYGLTWKGNVSGNWDLVTANWTNGSAAVTYAEGDAVTFDDTASNFKVTSDNPLSPASVVFNNNASNYTVSAAIAGTAALLQLGSGTTTLTGTNTYVGPTTISSGILKIGAAGQLGNGNYSANIFNGGVFEYAGSADQTHSGIISGMGSLVASGNGTLTLSGNNTYSGTTTVSGPGTLVFAGTNSYTGETFVNAGVLKILNGSGLGTIALGTTVAAGAKLELSGNVVTLAEALNLYGTLSSQTGSNTYAGVVTVLTGSPTFDVATGSFLILNGTPGCIAGAVTAPFTKTGGGTLRLAVDPNNYGTMTINGGVVEITSGTTDGNIIINSGGTFLATAAAVVNDANTVTVNTGGIYDLRGSDTISSLNGAGLVTKGTTGAAIALTVGGNNNGSGSFSGVIENGAGVLALTKVGTGVQILSGVNTYTGATAVSVGTLLVNTPGSLAAASAVSVASGAILGGNGTVNGPVTLSAGGNLAPGGVSSIGTLTLGNTLTLNGNTLFFDVSTASQDRVNVAAALTVTGVNTVVVNGSLPTGDYTLMTFASMTGAGSFSLVGMSNASLDTTSGTSLILHVASGSGGASLTWEGDKSFVWDGGILNWLNGSTPSAFAPGDAVLFDDTAFNYTVNSGSPAAPSTVMFNNNVNVYTVNAIIGGSASVSKFGWAIANLTATNTYSGPTIVGQGTLAITSAGQLGSGNYAQSIMINGGATFLYASSANQVLSGVLSGPGAFTKSGASTLILTNANTYTNATTLSGGTLIAKAFPTALGTGGLTLNTANTILELDSDTGVAFNNNATVSANMTNKTGRLTSGPGVTNTLGTLSINGSTLTVSQGANIASGTAGLTFGATTLTGTPTFDVGTGTLLTLGALGGSYNFTKQGVGTLFFGTAGSRTAGNSTLTAGTLMLGNATGLGTTGTTNVLNGGVLDLALDTTVSSYITTVGGNTTIQSDKATVNSDGITHALGNLTINNAWTLSVTNGPNVRVQSPFGLAFGTATLTANAIVDVANNGNGLGTLTLGAVSGNFSLTKKNFGVVKLVGTNVHGGATIINNGRVMGVSNASSSNSAVTIQATTLANANAGLAILCSVTNGQWVCTNLTASAATAPATAVPALDFLFTVPPSTNVAPLRVINNVVFGTNPVVNVYLGPLAVTATNYPLMVVGGTATNLLPTLNMVGGYTNSTLFWTNNTLTLKLVGTPLAMKWNPGVTSSGTWDVNNSANLVWTNGVVATYYQEPLGTGLTGDQVLFDDTTLAANSTVTLNSYVSPTAMTVSNQLYSYTINGTGVIAGTNSLTKQGTNLLILATANTYSGATTINGGIVTIPAGGAINNANLANVGQLTVATLATNATLNISGGTVNAKNGYLQVGTVAGANGVINLSSGSLTTSSEIHLGAAGAGVTGFGALNVSGGNVTSGSYLALARSNPATGQSRGELLVSGGTVTVLANNLEIGSYQNAAASTCVATLTGGSTIMAAGAGEVIVGKASNGILNMSGSGALTLLNPANGLRIVYTAGVTGIVNLNGGIITTPSVFQGAGTASYFNFNGGTLKANKANTTFMTGLTAARVFNGGAIIDDGGFAITIAQPLLTPATGSGVSLGTLSVSGSGFIAPPIVDIAGTGTGASAITTIDANGNLLGVTLTCPGVGYTGTPTFTFTGGGATVIKSGSASTVANTSGGLTKIGSGTLTLSAVNTYSGATVINNGKLLVLSGVSCSNSAVTVQPSGSGATALLAVQNSGANGQWTCNGLTTSAGVGGATANPALEFDFLATPSKTTAPLLVTGSATFDATPDVSVSLVNLNVPSGAYPLMVVGGTAPTAVPALSIVGGYAGSTLSWSGNTLMLNLVGTSSPITWNTGATGSGIWNINTSANQVWKTGAGASTYYQELTGLIGDQVLFADTYITTNTTVTLNTTVTPTSMSANNSANSYTISGSGLITGTTRLTKSGGATLKLSTANTYTGGTRITAGGVLEVGAASGLGTGSVTNDGILNLTYTPGADVTYKGLDVSLAGSGTNNVTLGTGAQSTILNGNYSGFTGLWNIGLNIANGPGRAVMTGLDNSAATINVLSNSTLWVSASGTHNATLVLNGGHQGEQYGQLRIDTGVWAGSVTIAGPITAATDGHIGSQNADGTITGIISEQNGPYVLTKVGGYKTTLTGNNTFLGPIWVKAGTIGAPSFGSINGGPSPLGAPTNPDQGLIRLGYLTAAGGLVYTGTGGSTDRLIDFAGTTGGVTLDQSGTGALTFTGGMMLSGVGNKTLTLQGSTLGSGEFSGVISNGVGSFVSVTKAGTGTWTLSNTNTYAGSTTLSGGKLIVANPNALGTNLLVLITGSATLDFTNDGGAGLNNYGFWFSSGLVSTISSGRATPGAAINRQLGYSGIGNSTLIFTNGANVTSGTPTFTIDSLNIAAGTSGTATLVPMTANVSIGTIAILAGATAAKTIQLDGTSSGNTVTGVISNGLSTLSLTKANTGTWTLFGANTYTGATAITSGKLVLAGVDGSILGTSGIVISGNGTLELQGTALTNNTNRLNDGIAISLNGGAFSFSHTGGDANYSEMAGALIITNYDNTIATSQADIGRTSIVSFASLTRTGSGTINFTGNGLGLSDQNKILFTNMANTAFIGLWATYNTTNFAAYDVNMGIIAGATACTNIMAKGPSVIPDDQTLNARITEEGTGGGISLSGGKTNKINSLLQNTTFAATVAMTNKTLQVSNVSIAPGMQSLTLGTAPNEGFLSPLSVGGQLMLANPSANVLTINAAITNNSTASSVAKYGSGAVVFMGTNTYTGTTLINEGLLEFGGISIQTLGGVISGNGGLVKSGTGTLTLNAANSYSGPTTISGGTVKAGNGSALGSATVGTTITSGGTLDVNGFALGDEVVTVAGAGVGNAGAIINSGAQQQQAFRFVTLSDDTTFGAANRWDIRNNPTATFDMGGHTLTKTGGNLFVLVQANVLNPGAINIQQGTVQFASGMTIGGSSLNSVTVQSGALMDLYAVTTPITWSLALSNNATLSVSSGTGTQNTWSGPVMLNGTGVLSSAYVLTLSGAITGTGPLLKIGTGTATLSGTTTYGGGTVVTNGTLVLTGSHTYTGGTFINTGSTLQLGDGTTANGSVIGNITNAATLTFNNPTANEYAGIIRGAGSVIKQANGVQTLSGLNTYTGETQFKAGILNVASLASYGQPCALGSRTLAMENTTVTGIGLHFLGGTLQYTGATPQISDRMIRIMGSLTANVTNTIDASGVGNGTLSFMYSGANTNFWDTGGKRTLTLTGSNTGTNLFAINIQNNSDTTTLIKSGDGKWVVTNPHNSDAPTTLNATYGGYTGGTVINGGWLGFATNAVGSTGAITFMGNAVLEWYGINSQDISSRMKIWDGVTATLNTGTNNVTLASVLQVATAMSGALNKTGTGTLTLAAANTYGGATTLTEGTLKCGVTNALPVVTDLTLAGGKLDLNGKQQTVASVSGTGILKVNPSIGPATSDRLIVSGTLNLTALTLELTGLDDLTRGQTYRIARAGTLTGTFVTIQPTVATSGWKPFYNIESGVITIKYVPGTMISFF